MSKSLPIRKCIACQGRFEKSMLLRIVKTNTGDIFVDYSGKSNGRGAYICNNIECFEKAVKQGSLNRAFKTLIDSDVIEGLREKIYEQS